MAKSPLAPLSATAWDRQRAQHLLNRAGFGIPRSRVDELAGMTPGQAVESLVNYESYPEPGPEPAFVQPVTVMRDVFLATKGLPEDERRRKLRQVKRMEREAVGNLAAWWVQRMETTQRPLEEKLTLFWHGHYATSAQKVRSSGAMFEYYDLLRRNATGNLKELTTHVGQSLAMLRYLDNDRNTKASPNENWARECMELFTMGVDNYTEHDVKNSARAFTGWTSDGKKFVFRENAHDYGDKIFLGRTGPFDGWDILDIIFEQPVTARFFAGKLWAYFAYDDPEPEVIEGLAATLRNNQYNLKPMLTQMFQSEAFYSQKAMGTQVKSPAQFVVQLAHDLQLDPVPYRYLTKASADLGQAIFYPPNVKGWDGNLAWADANSLLTRYNLPMLAISIPAEPPLPDTAQPVMADSKMMAPPQPNPMAQRRKHRRQEVVEMFRELPRDERAEWRNRFKRATNNDERLMIVGELGRRVNAGDMWQPQPLYAGLQCKTAGECVDQLVQRYLSVAPDATQRAVLIKALGAQEESTPLEAKDISEENMVATLHLFFSMAEYQLC